jgi:hypothetical protein
MITVLGPRIVFNNPRLPGSLTERKSGDTGRRLIGYLPRSPKQVVGEPGTFISSITYKLTECSGPQVPREVEKSGGVPGWVGEVKTSTSRPTSGRREKTAKQASSAVYEGMRALDSNTGESDSDQQKEAG